MFRIVANTATNNTAAAKVAGGVIGMCVDGEGACEMKG